MDFDYYTYTINVKSQKKSIEAHKKKKIIKVEQWINNIIFSVLNNKRLIYNDHNDNSV